jgi:hypothetical protein
MRNAIAALVLAVVVAGCGSADNEREVVSPLSRAASATQAENSARIEVQIVAEAGGQTVKVAGSGIVQFKPIKERVRLKTSAAGKTTALDEVMDGTTLYTKPSKNSPTRIPDGKSWLKLDLDKSTGGALSDAFKENSDPTSQLKLLSELGNPKVVGKETIDATATTHYHAELDYRKLATSGPPKLRKGAELALKGLANPVVPVDVWIDDHNRVRREQLKLSVKPTAKLPAQK